MYAPSNYAITITGKDVLRVPYNDVVKKCSIETGSYLVPKPFISDLRYKLLFEIRYKDFKGLLPEEIDPARIKVLFYEGVPTSREEAKVNEDITEHKAIHSKFKINTKWKTIQGECSFGFGNRKIKFISSDNKTFLNIAVQVHDVVVKYLVIDLFVLSSDNHHSKDHAQLHLGDKLKRVIEQSQCFWVDQALFAAPKEQRKKPKSETTQHSLVVAQNSYEVAKEAAKTFKDALLDHFKSNHPNAQEESRQIISEVFASLASIQSNDVPSVKMHEAPSSEPFDAPFSNLAMQPDNPDWLDEILTSVPQEPLNRFD